MKVTSRRSVLPSLVFGVWAAATIGVARGQTFETLGTRPLQETGSPIGRLLALPDGRIVGTTWNGGPFAFGGSVFSLSPDGAGGFTFEDLHDFSGPDGSSPRHGLILASDGRYYGTTYAGGAVNGGTIFVLDAAGRLTQLHGFPEGFGVDASELVEGPDGKFYGTTQMGGADSLGTLFRFDAFGTFEVLHDFESDGHDGFTPKAGLVVGPDGRLWGTTSGGGTGGTGTVYAVDVATGAPTIVHDFSAAEGASPSSTLAVAGGELFGTTSAGGAQSYGTVFRITTSGTLTPLYSFTGGADGAYPDGVTRAGDGNLYGLTPYIPPPPPSGGVPEIPPIPQTMFRITPAGVLTTLSNANLPGPLTLGADGNLYSPGTENAHYGGSVYRIDLTGTVSVAFVTGNDPTPFFATSNLVQSADGGLYGLFGGFYGTGIVRTDPVSGDFSTLYTFPTGVIVTNELRLGSDGNFYCTTVGDASTTFGTVVRVDPSGTPTTLHTFSGTDGSQPPASVTEAPGPEFWGVTQGGGANGFGTIYKIDAQGTFTSVHDFAGSDGSYPYAGLARAANGTFYGTTNEGGDQGEGTVFKIDPVTGFAVLHSFSFALQEGLFPRSSVLPASDGILYGTTPDGGTNSDGTIYKLDGAGNYTTINDLGAPGLPFFGQEYPGAVLIEVGSGTFYGTASQANAFGEVFQTDASGTVTSLHDFAAAGDGNDPFAPVVLATDGALYGTAQVVYRLLPSPVDPSITTLEPSSGRAAGGASVAVHGHHFGQGVAVTFGGAAGSATYFDRESRVVALAPALPPGTLQDVTVSNGNGTSFTLPGGWLSDFLDTPGDYLFHDDIETIFRAGITSGCGGGNYCPTSPVRRDQMAVLLLKAEHGSGYTPPGCAGVFPDVPCSSPFADWVEQLAAEGVTAGCGGGNYCPSTPVRRDQMAAFLLKTEHGASYVPPICTGQFSDVPCPSLFADWIEQLRAENVTGGCGGSNYCPASSNTRGQMAVFLTKTFSLP